MTLRHRAKALLYGTAYRMPARWRRRIVRLVAQKYIVGAVVLLRDADADPDGPGRIMLQRQPPGHGWSIPGGLVNRGEKPIFAAARELHEESGVRVDVADLTPMAPNVLIHTHGRWMDCVYTASVPASTPLIVDGAEVLEANWFRLDSLPPLTVPTARLLSYYGIGPYVGYPESETER
jgi:ADP-ribose pyrophosphatase YjhB (NUDIX family)